MPGLRFPLIIAILTAGFGLSLLTASAETTPGLSTKAEAAALDFARTNHAELASLLEKLKGSAPSEYRSAMIELDRARDRLERSREKTPERAELELAEWKVNSRIRLLAARLAMGGDSSLEADLKSALRERLDLRVQLMNDERTRLQRRLEKLNETIAEQERRTPDQVEKEFAGLKRAATVTDNTTRKNTKSAKSSETKPSDEKPAKKPSTATKPEKRPEKSTPSNSDKPSTDKKKSKP